MTWIVDASGTQTATIGTEHVLDTISTNATYVLWVDTVNMALSDLLELRIYYEVDAATERQSWKGTYQNVQLNPGKVSPPVPMTNAGKFTLKQTAGTGRTYPWQVLRI